MFQVLKGIRVSGLALIALVVAVVMSGNLSAAEASIPDIGINIGDYVSLAIVALATVVGVIAGGYFAFLIVKKGFTWGKKIG
jgi:hypothetical protein